MAVDYNNKIYQCRIDIVKDELSGREKVSDKIDELMNLNISDSDEESKKEKSINDRIYGIRFTHASNQTIDSSKDSCYIIAVTKNRFYQFKGPGFSNFKQIFNRYKKIKPYLMIVVNISPKENYISK